MADKLSNKKVGLHIDMNTEAAMRSAERLGNTLKRIAAGIPLNEYFKDTADLIENLRESYQQFQKEAASGRVSNDAAENLMKSANALSGAAAALKRDASSFVPEFDTMKDAIAQATKQAGLLSEAFSAANFREAFESFALLKTAGVDLSNEFKSLGSEHALSSLIQQNKELQSQLLFSKSQVQSLQSEIEELQNLDVGSVVRQLESLRDDAVKEVSAFFVANNIPQDWNSGFEEALDRIRDYNYTSGQAIAEWKENYGYLLGQSSRGTSSVLDPELFDELATKMQPIIERIDQLESVIRNVSAGGGIGSGNVEAIKEVVSALEHSGKATSNAVALLESIEKINSGSTDNLEMLRRSLNAISNLDRIKISKAVLVNLGDFFSKIQKLPDLTQLAALSSVNLKGFNDLKVSKASLENLATYLPRIADINTGAIERLASLPLEKLNNLTLKIDFGKDKFAKEAAAIDGLNAKFREHVDAVSEAINKEQEKLDVSRQLTEQLSKEKAAFEGTSGSGFVGSGTSGAASEVQKVQYTLEDLRVTLLKFGASEESVDSVIHTLKESGMEVAKIATHYDSLSGSLDKVQIAATDASGALKTVINVANNPKTNKWDVTQGDSVDFARIAQKAEKQAAAEAAALEKIAQAEREYYQKQEQMAFDAERTKQQQIEIGLEAHLRAIEREKEAEEAAIEEATRRELALMEEAEAKRTAKMNQAAIDRQLAQQRQGDQTDAAWLNAAEAAYNNLIAVSKEYYQIRTKIANDPNSERRGDWDADLQRAQEELQLAKQRASFYAQNTVNQQAYNDALRECNRLESEYNDLLAVNASKVAASQAQQETKAAKAQESAESRALSDTLKAYESAYQKMLNLKQKLHFADKEHADEYQRQIDQQQIILNALNDQIEKYRQIEGYAEAIQKSNAVIAEMNRDYEGKINLGDIDAAQKLNAGWDNLAKDLQKLGAVSEEFSTQYSALQNMIKARGANLDEARRKYDELRDAIKRAQKAEEENQKQQKEMDSAALTYDKLTNKVTAYFHKFESEIKKQPGLMAQYNQLLSDLGKQGFGLTKDGAQEAAVKVQEFQIACEQAGVGAKSFFERLIGGFGNKMLYMGISRAITYMRRFVRQIWTNVKEIDDAMAQLQIVTGASAGDMARYYDDAAASAKRLAVSIKDVIESTTTFARLGYSASDSNILAEYTAMLTKVGDIDTQSATDAVTALVKAFDLDISDVQLVMDQMVEVGNNFPISVSQLAEGMNNAGSALAAAGNTVEQSFALLTAANTTVQDISKASTALRTIAARIRRTTAEEMPEGEEAITEAKYNALVESLTKYKVSLVDVNNEYRSTYDIVKDIAAVWDQMSSMEHAALAENMSGTRNQNVFYSMVQQFQEAEGAMNAAANAAGAMSEAYEVYLDSISGRIGKLKADFEEMSQAVLNSDLAKGMISLVDALVQAVTWLSKMHVILPTIISLLSIKGVIEKWREYKAALDLLMTTLQNTEKLSVGMMTQFATYSTAQQSQIIKTVGAYNEETAAIFKLISAIASKTGVERLAEAQTLRDTMVQKGYTDQVIKATLASLGFVVSEEGIVTASVAATGAVKGLDGAVKGFMASNVVGWIMAIVGILVSAAIPLIQKYAKSLDDLREDYEKEKSALQDLEDQYKSNAERISELIDLKQKNVSTAENEEELQNLRDQNDQLALEIEYRKQLVKLKLGKTTTEADHVFTALSNAPTSYAGEAKSNIDMLDEYAQKLQAKQKELQDAYALYYQTGNRSEVSRVEAEIKEIINDGNDIIEKYYELKDVLSDPVKAQLEPLVTAFEQAAVDINLSTEEIVSAYDQALAQIYTDRAAGSKVRADRVNHTIVSDMLAIKHAAEDGDVSIQEYNEQLDQLLVILNGLVDVGDLPVETFEAIRALLSFDLSPGGVSLRATNATGKTITGLTDWLGGQNYNYLYRFNKFLQEADITGVTTLEDLIAMFDAFNNKTEEAASNVQAISGRLSDLNIKTKTLKAQGGNYDLNRMPSVKITDSNKDTLSAYGAKGDVGSYAAGLTKTYQNKKTAILVSPVLPDGHVLSEKELDKYVKNVIKAANAAGSKDYAAFDTQGLLVGVFGDKTTYEANKEAAADFVNEWIDLYEQLQSAIEAGDDDVAAKLYSQMQQLVQYAPTLSSIAQVFADVEDKFSQLVNALQEFEKNGKITMSTLGKITDTFGDLGSYDNYIRTLTNSESKTEDVTEATRQLAAEYLTSTNALDMFRSGNASVVSAMLEQVGVTTTAQSALENFARAMQIASTTSLDLSAQIAQIWEITSAALAGSSAISGLFSTALMSSSGYEELYPIKDENGNYNEWFLASGLTPDEWYKQQMMDSLQLNMRNSLKVDWDKLKDLGKGTGGGGGGSKSTDKYVADIDQFRKEIEALNKAQERRAEIERELSRVEKGYTKGSEIDRLKQQIAYQREIVDLLRDEQAATENLSNARKSYIEKGADMLRQMGFIVSYNSDLNELSIDNMEKLRDLSTTDLTKYELMADLSMEVIGTYNSAEEASNDYIKRAEEIIERITEWNDANKDNADSWEDLADSISDADKKIKQLLDDIVSAASSAVDNLQSVYDTLHKAADEYAASGFVSIDTVQALIGLGTQYMQYLIDENGQLVINEERIKAVIAAKMEQLALENALAYVEALRIAKEAEDIDTLNNLIFATEAATDATWGLVYAQLKALGLTDEQYAAALHNINAIRSLAKASVQSIGDETESMKKGVDDILKYVMEMLKQQVQDQIDALNEQKKAYSDIIAKQKESIQLKKKEDDYSKSQAKKLKEMAKLQAQIDALSLDDSRDAQAKRAKLMEQLAELQEDLDDESKQHSIDAQEDALDDMEKKYHEEKDKEIKILEDSISSYQKLYDMAIKYIEEHWDTLLDELTAWNYEYGSVLTSEITAAWDAALAAAQKYGSYLAALQALSNPSSPDNPGIVGDVEDFPDDEYQPRVYKVREDWTAPPGLNVGDYVVTGGGLYKITSNAGGYKSDRVIQWSVQNYDELEPIFQEWKRKIEQEGLRYHTGGIAGRDPSLKENEMFAILNKGEAVLTTKHEDTVIQLIDFMEKLRNQIDDVIQKNRTTPSPDDIFHPLIGGSEGTIGGTVEVNFGDVYINGADDDTVAKHKEVNREFVNEVIKVLNLRK